MSSKSRTKTLPRTQLGQPILRAKAKQLSKKDIVSKKVQRLIDDMFYTLRRTGGVGLAAPQVGVSLALAVVNVASSNKNHPRSSRSPKKRERFVMINPRIISSSKKTHTMHEGCLSFIDIFGEVKRPSQVRVSYQDQSGERVERTLNGLVATVFQHEYDHLQGTVWIDRATDTKSFMTKHEYQRFKLKETVK